MPEQNDILETDVLPELNDILETYVMPGLLALNLIQGPGISPSKRIIRKRHRVQARCDRTGDSFRSSK